MKPAPSGSEERSGPTGRRDTQRGSRSGLDRTQLAGMLILLALLLLLTALRYWGALFP
jgi:hypothetical protein